MKNDLAQYPDDFIRSQREYWRRNLRCGPSRDWDIISGQYGAYGDELVRRGLLRYDPIRGCLVESTPVA